MILCMFTSLVCSNIAKSDTFQFNYSCAVVWAAHGSLTCSSKLMNNVVAELYPSVLMVSDVSYPVILGEDMFLKLQRKNVRTSRDWVGNRWVDIKAKPDIQSYLSENASRLKVSMSSAMAEVSGRGGSALLEPKVCTSPRLETVVEDEQELTDLTISDDLLEKMRGVNLRKQPREDENGDNNDNSDLDSANRRCA